MAHARLRIGCVQYLNARPFIHGWPDPIFFDHPSALCHRLAAGELDIALVSSFEYLRNPVYAVVNGLAIASAGPVYSVVVAHKNEVSQLREISLDPASQTSGNLLRCLLAEENLAPALVERSSAAENAVTADRGCLFIGDQAIRFRQEHGSRYHYWDLGEAWQTLSDLPFVYAFWLVRPGVPSAESVARRLRHQLDRNFSRLDAVIAANGEFEPKFCEYYYRDCIHFTFGARERDGLIAFQRLCEKHRILPRRETELRLI